MLKGRSTLFWRILVNLGGLFLLLHRKGRNWVFRSISLDLLFEHSDTISQNYHIEDYTSVWIITQSYNCDVRKDSDSSNQTIPQISWQSLFDWSLSFLTLSNHPYRSIIFHMNLHCVCGGRQDRFKWCWMRLNDWLRRIFGVEIHINKLKTWTHK